MTTVYIVVMCVCAGVSLICLCFAIAEMNDSDGADRAHMARWSLRWLSAIPLAPLWPLILPILLGTGLWKLIIYLRAEARGNA